MSNYTNDPGQSNADSGVHHAHGQDAVGPHRDAEHNHTNGEPFYVQLPDIFTFWPQHLVPIKAALEAGRPLAYHLGKYDGPLPDFAVSALHEMLINSQPAGSKSPDIHVADYAAMISSVRKYCNAICNGEPFIIPPDATLMETFAIASEKRRRQTHRRISMPLPTESLEFENRPLRDIMIDRPESPLQDGLGDGEIRQGES